MNSRFEILDGGGRIVQVIPLKEFTLLPGDRYPLEASWTGPPLVGSFTARFVAETADAQPLVKNSAFWVVSWAALAVVTCSVLALALLTVFVRKFVHIEIKRADPQPATD